MRLDLLHRVSLLALQAIADGGHISDYSTTQPERAGGQPEKQGAIKIREQSSVGPDAVRQVYGVSKKEMDRRKRRDFNSFFSHPNASLRPD